MKENATNGMLIVDRIDNLLKKKGENRVTLADALGIKPQNISAWSTRGTVPAGDICLRIAEYLNVSVEWLISGKESGLSNEEKWLLAQWGQLEPTQQDTVRTLLDKWEADRTAREKKDLEA